MIPGKKYSETFWNLVKQSSGLCKVLNLPHAEVLKNLGDLNCVNGFAKEKFLVIEFHHFVIVAFREEPVLKDGSYPELNQEAVIDFRFTCRRVVEKLELKIPKPVYFAGHGSAAITAIFSATKDFVSGVVTFGTPEQLCLSTGINPQFPFAAIYSFQLAEDEAVKLLLSDSFNHRMVIPQKYIKEGDRSKAGIGRFVAPLNRSILDGWAPKEPLPPLDDLLDELREDVVKPGIVPLSHHVKDARASIKSPLKVVVYFHTGDKDVAKAYIKSLRQLFDGFSSENDGYLAGIGGGYPANGLPGVLRVISQPPCEKDADKIKQYFNDTLHTLFIVLMDDCLAADNVGMEWLDLATKAVNGNEAHIVLPIGMYDRAFDKAAIYQDFSKIQRTTATRFGEFAVHSSYAAILVVHEAFKLLGESLPEKRRLTIFLSHTKKDGLPLANAIWSQLSQLPGNVDHNGFYDSISLEPGKPWDEQLRAHAGKCVMLVLRTKMYESRAWCREEFLTAFKEDVPVIVVDARSNDNLPPSIDSANGDVTRETVLPFNRFPVTHVRDGNLIRVIGLTLIEGLRQLVFERDVEQARKAELTDRTLSPVFRLNSGVEGLMGICRKLEKEKEKHEKCRVIYQEPEISEDQQEAFEIIIKSFFPLGTLRTCTRMYDEDCNKLMDTSLAEKMVGISIAGVDGTLEEIEANKLTLHAVERLFSHGASVAFGHDWREGGIMQAVYDSMKRSMPSGVKKSEGFRILNLVPWLNGVSESKGKKLEKGLQNLRVESTALPTLVPVKEGAPEFGIFAKVHPELMKALNAVALSEMRRLLTEKCSSRICIGGKMLKSTGTMAGILEEAALAIEQKQPLYLCGHWGGATGAICDILRGKGDLKSADFSPDPVVTDQLATLAENWQLPNPDLDAAFEVVSNYSMEQLKQSNGLSIADNEKLFELSDIRQIMSLVIKGLTHRIP